MPRQHIFMTYFTYAHNQAASANLIPYHSIIFNRLAHSNASHLISYRYTEYFLSLIPYIFFSLSLVHRIAHSFRPFERHWRWHLMLILGIRIKIKEREIEKEKEKSVPINNRRTNSHKSMFSLLDMNTFWLNIVCEISDCFAIILMLIDRRLNALWHSFV